MNLYPYQVDDHDWLVADGRAPDVALLWHELGVGKTTVAAAAAATLAARGWGVLALCPPGVRTTWRDRLRAWAPGVPCEVLRPGATFRWPGAGRAVVAGYSVGQRGWVGASSRAASSCPRPVALILDEGHVLCSRASAQAAAVRDVANAVQARGGKVWHLTATPFETSPDQLLATLEALRLLPATWGTAAAFRDFFGHEDDGFGGEAWAGPEAPVHNVLGRFMRRLSLVDVRAHLPPVRVHRVDLRPGAALGDLDRLGALAGGAMDAAKRGDPDAELPDDGPLAEVRVALAAAKLPHLHAYLDRLEAGLPADERVAAYSYHEESIGFAASMAARPGWRVISGGAGDRRRARVMRSFQAGECHLAVTSAVTSGVDLHRGNHLVLSDLSWRPLLVEGQLIGRFHRPGQTRPMHLHYLRWDHPVERAVHRVHARKLNLFARAFAA